MNVDIIKELKFYGVKAELELESESDFTTLNEQFEFHKFMVNMKIQREITSTEAFFSWYENYYKPLFLAISKAKLWKKFEHLTKLQIFVNISKHWYFMKKEDEAIDADLAVYDFASKFASQFASGSFQRFWSKVKGIVA